MKQFFAGGEVDVLPFTMETADRFSITRATTGVRPPDAIHLATAAVAQTDVFLTNDDQLFSLQIPGIKFIAGLDERILGWHAP